MTSPTPLPLMFTLPPSNRHELLLLDSSSTPSLKALNKQITAAIATSPNCAEFMAHHKPPASTSQDQEQEQITELRMHWSASGRDRKIWPEWTVVTEENFGAVLEVLRARGVGRDVLEVRVGKVGE